MALSKSQLQQKIDALIAANTRAAKARNALWDHCMEVYGASWSDLDVDDIIDGLGDGGSLSPGLDADEFTALMDQASRPQD